jgi:choice-of-anchor A domain-containing protein
MHYSLMKPGRLSALLLATWLGVLLVASFISPAMVQATGTATVTDCGNYNAVPGGLGDALKIIGGSGTIIFQCSGSARTIVVPSEIDVSGPLTLYGNGQNVTLTLISNKTFFPYRLFGVGGNGNLILKELTIAGADAQFFDFTATGVIVNSGRLSVDKVTFTNNTRYRGGAIYNVLGTTTVTNSTFANNRAFSFGGAIYNGGGTTTVTNSTFANNRGTGGGAIFNIGGTTTVTNSTFANNRGTGGGAAISSSDTNNIKSTIKVQGSIFANNSDVTCINFGSNSITDLGYNLSTDGSCNFTAIGSVNNVSAADLKLGPLADNGGPTQTIALLTGSRAIDAIPATACAVSTDQRGVARPQGNGCDIGAFELMTVKADQTISFNVPAFNYFPYPSGNNTFTVGATASSGLPVSFSASGPCSVNGTTVTITGVGACVITASQAGNANYSPAQPVSRTFNSVPNPTGFNILSLGTASLTSTQTQGPVAALGNTSFLGTNIGYGFNGPNAISVQGNVSFGNWGNSVNGNVVYSGSLLDRYVTFQRGGFVQNQNALSPALKDYALKVSAAWAALPTNGTINYTPWGQIILTGTNQTQNVFNLDGAKLSTANSLTIQTPANVPVIINVSGTTDRLQNLGINLVGPGGGCIVFNFYEATSLTLSSVGVNGTVWAPKAAVSFTSASLRGSLIAGSLSDSSGGYQQAPFDGSLPAVQ